MHDRLILFPFPFNILIQFLILLRFEEYPQLKDLLLKKDDLINLRNTQPFYLNTDLEKFDLASLNTTFDVILMDPPLEEYVAFALIFFVQY